MRWNKIKKWTIHVFTEHLFNKILCILNHRRDFFSGWPFRNINISFKFHICTKFFVLLVVRMSGATTSWILTWCQSFTSLLSCFLRISCTFLLKFTITCSFYHRTLNDLYFYMKSTVTIISSMMLWKSHSQFVKNCNYNQQHFLQLIDAF